MEVSGVDFILPITWDGRKVKEVLSCLESVVGALEAGATLGFHGRYYDPYGKLTIARNEQDKYDLSHLRIHHNKISKLASTRSSDDQVGVIQSALADMKGHLHTELCSALSEKERIQGDHIRLAYKLEALQQSFDEKQNFMKWQMDAKEVALQHSLDEKEKLRIQLIQLDETSRENIRLGCQLNLVEREKESLIQELAKHRNLECELATSKGRCDRLEQENILLRGENDDLLRKVFPLVEADIESSSSGEAHCFEQSSSSCAPPQMASAPSVADGERDKKNIGRRKRGHGQRRREQKWRSTVQAPTPSVQSKES
jgi:hypothetical protein